MFLRDTDFGNVFCASGARNFFGEGWRQNPWFVDWQGSTLVTKTTTLGLRDGNMPLNENLQPREWLPRCITLFPLQGAALNSVGLSGPGAGALLGRGFWQKREEPFVVSFMSVGSTPEGRLRELTEFKSLFDGHLGDFQAKIALEINFSCPNVGLKPAELLKEVLDALRVASDLTVPLIVKLNALAPPATVAAIADNPLCDAIFMSNTIPFGAKTDPPISWWRYSRWYGLRGVKSPLVYLGGGGLSGKPIFPVVCKWLEKFRKLDVSNPVIAGGGVFSKRDAIQLLDLGASAISLGTVAMLRPWRVQEIIQAVNKHCCRT